MNKPPDFTEARRRGTAPSRARCARLIGAALLLAGACSANNSAGPEPATTASSRPAATLRPASAQDERDLANRKLAFVFKGGLYTANGDGSSRRLIARVPNAYAGPYWSPAANAFVIRGEKRVGRGKFHGFVYRVDADGTVKNLSAQTRRTTDAMVGWAPDGKEIIFTSRPPNEELSQLFVMSSDGTKVRQLTDLDMEAQYPAWSPDGRRIAFTGVVHESNFEIFVMDADGSNLTRLTDAPTAENWPTWSGDSTRIAFSRDDEIWVIDADGSDERLVTVPEDVAGGEPNWSPDGEWIAFDCSFDAPVMCAIHPDGSGFTRLFGRGGFPFWLE